MTHGEIVIKHFKALDKLLQTKGFPAVSPWWMKTITEFYLSGKRQLVIRAGRRAGKSSTLSRLAVVEALYGKHNVPIGDTGVCALVSVKRDEAGERLTTIKAILDALGVPYSSWGEFGIKLDRKNMGFRVYTASIAGVSGMTCTFVLLDEVSKMRDADTGQNPATEVIRSIRPTMATQNNAKMILSSSPMSTFDAHADAFAQGNTDFQMVAHATTWEANNSITEAETRLLEPDEIIWKREFAAEPTEESVESFFTASSLDRVTRAEPLIVEREQGVTYYAAMDPSSGGNAWTLVIGGLRLVGDGEMRRSIVYTREWRGSKKAELRPKQVLTEMKPILDSYGVDVVYTDQYSGAALRDLAYDLGITLVVSPWTMQNKQQAFRDLQTLIRTDQIELSPDPQVKADLLGVRLKMTRSGSTIDFQTTPDGRHCDYAPAIAKIFSLAMAQPIVQSYTEGTEAHRRAMRREQYKKQQEAESRGSRDRGPTAVWRGKGNS